MTDLLLGRVHHLQGDDVHVTVPAYDRGARVHRAFGRAPTAQPGDLARVQLGQDGRLVLVATQPA